MAKLDKVDGRWVNLEKPGGKVIFVGGGTAAYNGVGASDTFPGTRPEEPKSTIDGASGAVNNCTSGRGDTIVMLPGSITITTAMALDVADLTLTGYVNVAPGERPPCVIVNATDVNSAQVTADNVVIENLTFDCNVATATADTEVIQISGAGIGAVTGTVIRNCFFDQAGADSDLDVLGVGFDSDDTSLNALIEGCTFHDVDQIAIRIPTGSDANHIIGCTFYDEVSANIASDVISIAGDDTVIRDCTIRSGNITNTQACILLEATALNTTIDRCHLWANGANGICVLLEDGAEASGLNCHAISSAAATLWKHGSDVDGISGVTGIMHSPADASACELMLPTAS